MNPLVLCFVARLFFDDKASKDASPSVQKHMQTSPSHRNNVCKMVLVALPSSFHHPCYCSYLHPPPPNLHKSVCILDYMCVSVTASAVLARDYRGFATRRQRGCGMPHVWAQVWEKRAACLSAERQTAAGRVFWLLSQVLQLSLLLTHSSADSGGPCLYSSRLSARPLQNHIWADCSFNIQVWYLSGRLLQFRLWSFKCCLAHFPLLSLVSW